MPKAVGIDLGTTNSVVAVLEADWSADIDGKSYTAQEISARILGKAEARR